ncbi:MAG: reverse transcriptase-like protein [Endomicrobium sp.]|jgi:ribonuclease HI|nr:reverse transcriptase-like protein [Endomicrobium sp.]
MLDGHTKKTILYKKELKNRALEFQKELKSQGTDIAFDNMSFRDYLVILNVNVKGISIGKLFLYYKPTKKTYSLKRQISNPKTDAVIELIWNKLNSSDTYSAESGIYEAFVDGSYIAGVTGYGAVIYLGNEIKAEISGVILDTQFRQFGGELQAVIEMLKWCHDNNVKKIRINYDYEGIEKFATGKWKARNTLSSEYANFFRKVQIIIEWRHIKSHTGNVKNNRADFLARKACHYNNKQTITT